MSMLLKNIKNSFLKMNDIKTVTPQETNIPNASETKSIVLEYNPHTIKSPYDSIAHSLLMSEMDHKLAER